MFSLGANSLQNWPLETIIKRERADIGSKWNKGAEERERECVCVHTHVYLQGKNLERRKDLIGTTSVNKDFFPLGLNHLGFVLKAGTRWPGGRASLEMCAKGFRCGTHECQPPTDKEFSKSINDNNKIPAHTERRQMSQSTKEYVGIHCTSCSTLHSDLFKIKSGGTEIIPVWSIVLQIHGVQLTTFDNKFILFDGGKNVTGNQNYLMQKQIAYPE